MYDTIVLIRTHSALLVRFRILCPEYGYKILVPLIYPQTASGGLEVSDERTGKIRKYALLHRDSDAFASLRLPCFLIGSWSPVLTGLLVGKCTIHD